jgi:ring-1,2-phenylacetyl-CoA epoxidase subunit PaaD
MTKEVPLAYSVARIRAAVASVPDPELGGVTIGDLGLIVAIDDLGVGDIRVRLTPTFLGCPALNLMRADVELAARTAGARSVEVVWVHDVRWNTDLINDAARAQLGQLGIAVPARNNSVSGVDREALPNCPSCGSSELIASLPVGPTACRSVAWCRGCRSVIEIMRSSYAHV